MSPGSQRGAEEFLSSSRCSLTHSRFASWSSTLLQSLICLALIFSLQCLPSVNKVKTASLSTPCCQQVLHTSCRRLPVGERHFRDTSGFWGLGSSVWKHLSPLRHQIIVQFYHCPISCSWRDLSVGSYSRQVSGKFLYLLWRSSDPSHGDSLWCTCSRSCTGCTGFAIRTWYRGWYSLPAFSMAVCSITDIKNWVMTPFLVPFPSPHPPPPFFFFPSEEA